MAKKKSNFDKDYKKLIKHQKEYLDSESDDDYPNNRRPVASIKQRNEFDESKKMKWWSWLVGVIGAGVACSIPPIVAEIVYKITGKGSADKPGHSVTNLPAFSWTAMIVMLVLAITILIIAFVKHEYAKHYYNDKRKRYQPTYTKYEANLILTKKILIFTLILSLPALITFVSI